MSLAEDIEAGGGTDEAVAWLRAEAKELGPSSYHRAQRDILLFEADAIERGDHWKGSSDEG